MLSDKSVLLFFVGVISLVEVSFQQNDYDNIANCYFDPAASSCFVLSVVYPIPGLPTGVNEDSVYMYGVSVHKDQKSSCSIKFKKIKVGKNNREPSIPKSTLNGFTLEELRSHLSGLCTATTCCLTRRAQKVNCLMTATGCQWITEKYSSVGSSSTRTIVSTSSPLTETSPDNRTSLHPFAMSSPRMRTGTATFRTQTTAADPVLGTQLFFPITSDRKSQTSSSSFVSNSPQTTAEETVLQKINKFEPGCPCCNVPHSGKESCIDRKRISLISNLDLLENNLFDKASQLDVSANVTTHTKNIETAMIRERVSDVPPVISFEFSKFTVNYNLSDYRAENDTDANSSIMIVSTQFLLHREVTTVLKSERSAKKWNGLEQHFLPSESIPYMSISGYDGREKIKLNGSVVFQLNQPYEEAVENEILSFVYKNKMKKTVYVKTIAAVCNFVDTQKQTFSSNGCESINEKKFGPVTCKCNHTTVFAILLSVQAIVVPYGVKICSYATETLSVVSLASILAVLSHNRVKINSDRTSLQINFSVSLLVLHVLNLCHDVAVEVDNLCVMLAISVHYFLLSTVMWMLAEGLRLLLKTSHKVLSYSTLDPRKVLMTYCFLGWGIPAIIVLASSTFGIVSNTYLKPCYLHLRAQEYKKQPDFNHDVVSWVRKYDVCWLDPTTVLFLSSVIIPIGITLSLNIAIAIKVTVSLNAVKKRSKELQNKTNRHNNAETKNKTSENFISTVKALMTLLTILGAPWAIGFVTGLTNYEASVVMMYLNAIVNGLQGVFVFVLCYPHNLKKIKSKDRKTMTTSPHKTFANQSSNKTQSSQLSTKTDRR
ncbi:adhesion G-protein coupled receptor G7-like [Clavelina lepadiformis]|uniref:adhesion G-protein coupled receptor G7-like n=1 Tax=Clavelina lepadiformis TaxID=159417 RepID=UPI004042C410